MLYEVITSFAIGELLFKEFIVARIVMDLADTFQLERNNFV